MKLLNISTGSIFLLGPINTIEKEHYYNAKEILEDKGKHAITPIDVLCSIEIENTPTRKFINLLVANMAMCDQVITLEGWEECEHAAEIVAVARVMKKEVSFSVQFLRKLQQNDKA